MDKDPFFDRPIVLSPQPDHQTYQRNLSVGYNLQQEFEALKADLDLDLASSMGAGNGAHVSSSENTHSSTASLTPNNGNLGQTNGATVGAQNVPAHSSVQRSLTANLLAPTTLNPALVLGLDGLNRTQAQGGLGSLLQLKSSSFFVPSRPHSVNNASSHTQHHSHAASSAHGTRSAHSAHSTHSPYISLFYSDMLGFTSWMESLDPRDVLTMLDHWCNHLPFDILLTMRSRLDAHLDSQSTLTLPDLDNLALDKSSHRLLDSDYSLDDHMRAPGVHSALAQPRPKAHPLKLHLFSESKVPRPKSADPQLATRLGPMARAVLPTSHLHEKTNFLQLAAALTSLLYPRGHEDFDLSSSQKLGALNTINSRVALDSNRKQTSQEINRMGNSQSVPAPVPKYGAPLALNMSKLSPDTTRSGKPHSTTPPASFAQSGGPNGAVPFSHSVSSNSSVSASSNPANPVGAGSGSGGSPSAPATSPNSTASMPAEIANVELLNNIAAWLKLLRLHKYTDCLKGVPWRELVELSDEQLESRGVKALGARRKLLKAFDAVKAARG